eukprot:557378-Rhodomonas_salina.1
MHTGSDADLGCGNRARADRAGARVPRVPRQRGAPSSAPCQHPGYTPHALALSRHVRSLEH